MKKKLLLVSISLVLLLGCGQHEILSPTPEPTATLSRSASGLGERIHRVENGLLPIGANSEIMWGELATLVERMEHYHVPGVSIAVFDNFEIQWARGYGLLKAGTDEPVTPDTLFHAGSVAKPVAAAAALALVERDLLELDENVNDKLVSWRIPESEHTVEERVTLRRLLSHSAGLEDGITNRSSDNPLPTYLTPAGEAPTVKLQQLLNSEPGVDTDGPTRVTTVPGTEYRYSNAGYVIVELLMVDAVQKPFPDIMQETVLGPLGMASSTFEKPLPLDLRARAATEHDVNGQPFEGERLHFPFLALWTTPSDLARFAIEIMLAYEGQSDKLLSQDMAIEMLTPQIDTPNEILGDFYGLGFHLAAEDRALVFRHSGGTWGSTCLLWAYPETGQGAVVMTNSASGGGIIRLEILLSIAAEYGWPLSNDS